MESAELISRLIDVAIGLATVLGMLGSVWLVAHKRLISWWKPYREGIDGMAQVPGLMAAVNDVRGSLGMLTLMVRARGDINIESAEFECDVAGAHTYVNLTYARWLGVGKSELMDWGFINFIHDEDRIRVRREWELSRAEHRIFNQRYRVVSSDKEVITVDTLITPIPESPPTKHWIGVMRRVIA